MTYKIIFLILYITSAQNIPIIGIHGIFSNSTLLDDFANFISEGTLRQFINLEYSIFEKKASIVPIYDQVNDLCTLMYLNKDIRNAEELDFVGLSDQKSI